MNVIPCLAEGVKNEWEHELVQPPAYNDTFFITFHAEFILHRLAHWTDV